MSIMSNNVDRNQVLRTTRVRTALKKDGSWIHKSQPEEAERDAARTDHSVEASPAAARPKSYVFSAAKKFHRSVASPLSPPFQKTQLSPSKGDSAKQANGEVILPHKDAQPEGATLKSIDDTKPQTPTEEIIQNTEPEKVVANTAAENKEEHADTPVGQSNVEHSERAAEVCADAHVRECIQNGEAQKVLSTKQNPAAVSPAELPVANTVAENKEEYANTEQKEAKVSTDTSVEDPVAETLNVAGIRKNKPPSEIPAVLVVEAKPQEEPLIETVPVNATHSEGAGGEPAIQHGDKCPSEQSRENIVEAVAEVVMELSPKTPAVNNATSDSVEPVGELLVESVSESPAQCASEAAAVERCPPKQTTHDAVEAVAEAVVESSPETPAINNAAPVEKAAGEPALNTRSVTPAQTAPEAAVEAEAESVAPAEPVLKTRAEVAVECEEQPLNKAVVEQSAEPAPDNAAGHLMELSTEDVHEPVTASEAVATQAKLSDRAIELTDALDVEPPTDVEDPKPSHSDEPKLNLPDTSITEKSSKEQLSTHTLKETSDGKAVCSFCDQVIGNVKITLSEPPLTCHPDCLKCGVCAKALGDMLTAMFLHDQVIHCGDCFAKAPKT